MSGMGSTAPKSSSMWVASIIVLTMLAASALGLSWGISAFDVYLDKKPIEAPDGRRVSEIPEETQSWRRIGSDRIESAEMLEELGTTNYLSRTYVQKNPEDPAKPHMVELHVAYYTGQIDTVPHVPERCFVGGGLAIGEGTRPVKVPLDTEALRVDRQASTDEQTVYTTRLSNLWSDRPGATVRLPGDPTELEMLITGFLQQGGNNFYSGYFFIANGGTVASARDVRLLSFKLTDDYSFYCKVQTTSFTAESHDHLAELTASLLDELYGEIARCVPDWVEVTAGRYPEPEQEAS